jgi:peptidoglycan/xylan/chitin deacetylase (PgdA/CDA1 family)
VTAPGAGTIVVHGPSERPRFALTFDDGPGPCTAELLELLDQAGAKATFFLVARQVENDPALARRVRDAGHEIGLHSMAHLDHERLEREQAVADVVDGAALIERELDVELRLFRAPYGHFVPGTLAEAERRRWRCVSWSAWGEDWLAGESADSIAARVLVDLGPGAIVLLHDSRREKAVDCARMLTALESILDDAERRGLEPVTVSELLA